MVARRAHNPEVAGSSPVPATILIGRFYCRQFFVAVSPKSDVLEPAERRLFPLLSPPLSGGFGRVSVHRRPSGPPLLGVWRPFFGFGRKNRHRSIENFPPEFCSRYLRVNQCSKSTTNSIWRRHVWPGFRHPLDTGLFCLSALLPGREEITGPVDSLQLVPYRKRGIP